MARRRPVEVAVAVAILTAAFGAAWVTARGSAPRRSPPAPIRLDAGIPVGVLRSPAGALAAADNYVATGVMASLDPQLLGRFAATLIVPTARPSFLTSSQRLLQTASPPPGSQALGVVVAHALRSYSGELAQVSTWDFGSYWGPMLEPQQYWALTDVLLRWSGGRWQIASVIERTAAPVPALLETSRAAGTTSVWGAALAGMDGPYYGAG